ncbi:MAG: HAMP domain-containing protein [Magnetospirillum sp.]|nr:HAMP domain-containing protein [Magnetospirillum sp.]
MSRLRARFLSWLDEQRRSAITRLIVYGILLVSIGLVVRLGIFLPFLRDRLFEQSASHQLSIAEYVARDIDIRIRARIDFLDYLAGHLPAPLLNDPRAMEAWLREHQETNPLFSKGLVVVPADGRRAVADFPVVPGRRDLDFSDSDYFRRALDERRAVIGKPMRGRASGEPVVVMATPIRDGSGKAVGVLAGVTALTASGFLNVLQDSRLGQTGGFLLISPRDNLFVAATDTRKVLTPLPPPGKNPLHDQAMAGYRGTGVTVNIHGVEELSAMASVPSADWFLVARIPTAEALKALDATRDFAFRNIFISTVTILLFAALALRRFFRPLTTASQLLRRMAAGEIDMQPLPVKRRDEIGELAEGFNTLLARLDDITAQKLTAERLRVEEQERMETSLRQWMADTSHELRTPIAVLRAQVEAIQDGVNPVDARTLGVLHGEVMGLSRLVDDLHTLARSDVGHLDCRFSPMAPLDLMDDVLQAFRERIVDAGLMVERTARPTPEPVIAGDLVRLRQVFSNLLENSLRYTDAGGWLRIGSRIADGHVELSVEDSAPGVPPDSLPRLFERFFRVDSSRSRVRGGTGIGLAVCLSIVEAHGGTITAQPSPLGGLKIDVHLPLAEGST